MRIAVDLLPIRPDGAAGGATGFAIELVKGLSKKQDVSIVVICAEWNKSYLEEELPSNIDFFQSNVTTKRYTGRIRVDALINRVLGHFRRQKSLEEKNIDILYCPFSAPTNKIKGVPCISTILDIQHEYYPQFFAPEELQHRRDFYNQIVKKVERVVCISDYTKETFCEKYNYPIDRAETVYIAIQNRFTDKDDSVLDRLGVEKNKYIVYPANFWEHKNHKLLLNAFAMYIEKTGTELKLVLTGNALDKTDYYNDLISSMKLDKNVVITGYVSKEELYSILDNSKGLIYPSLFEGFGIPVVEAMHLHKPIACSNLTSLPEIGCEAIYYFNPKKPDEIYKGIEYLEKTVASKAMIDEYEAKLEEYTDEKMVDSYYRVLKETVGKTSDYIFEEGVEGLYPDGWTAPQMSISLKDRNGYRLEATISHPVFIKAKQTVFVESRNGKDKIELCSGEKTVVSREISSGFEEISLTVARPWSPHSVLKSDDQRQLGVMIEKIVIVKDGEEFDLKEMV